MKINVTGKVFFLPPPPYDHFPNLPYLLLVKLSEIVSLKIVLHFYSQEAKCDLYCVVSGEMLARNRINLFISAGD